MWLAANPLALLKLLKLSCKPGRVSIVHTLLSPDYVERKQTSIAANDLLTDLVKSAVQSRQTPVPVYGVRSLFGDVCSIGGAERTV